MANPSTPAEMRAYIVERLVGDTGEPDHVRDTARSLAERALPNIRKGLAELLSAPLAIELSEVELTRFAMARPKEGEHVAMTIVASPASPDALILAIDSQALAIIVSALFGGDPDLPAAPIERALSPTEVEIAAMAFNVIAEAINGSGPRAFEFDLPLPKTMTGPELAKQIIRDGPAVRVDYRVGSSDGAGRISLMMPQRVLMKKRGVKSLPMPVQAVPADSGWSDRFGEEVMRSSVVLEATMPLARLTLSDVAGFYKGSPRAGRFAGFSSSRMVFFAFMLSGGLAGLAGISEVSGAIGQLRPSISPGYGFTAIIVAFLGRLNPLGIIAAGLILALTYLGGEAAQISLGISDKVARVFQGMLLFFVLGCDTLIHYRVRFSGLGAAKAGEAA